MEQTTPPQQQQQLLLQLQPETRPADQQRQQQPISQYQQFQQPFQPQGQMMRAVHVSSRGMWTSKLSLRIASIISCIIIIGVSAAIAASYDILPIVEFAPPAGVALVWDLAESICLCVRRGHRGIHPGAVVAIDLLLWLGYVVAIVFLGLFGISYSYYYYYYDYDDDYSSYAPPMSRAIFAFGVIEILIHLTLFIIACYETNARNKNSQVVYVQPNMGGAVMYPPPNFQMAQVYQQPGYPQYPAPVQQPYQYYYMTPQDQQPKTEMQSTVASTTTPVQHQPSSSQQ